MEIRFSMTPRLLALAAVFGLALLVLVFSVGFLLGQQIQASGISNAAGPSINPPQVSVPQPPSAPGVDR